MRLKFTNGDGIRKGRSTDPKSQQWWWSLSTSLNFPQSIKIKLILPAYQVSPTRCRSLTMMVSARLERLATSLASKPFMRASRQMLRESLLRSQLRVHSRMNSSSTNFQVSWPRRSHPITSSLPSRRKAWAWRNLFHRRKLLIGNRTAPPRSRVCLTQRQRKHWSLGLSWQSAAVRIKWRLEFNLNTNKSCKLRQQHYLSLHQVQT